MTLQVIQSDIDAIRTQAEAAFPHEGCGFLLGAVDGEHRVVREIRAAGNAREESARYHRFLIAPDEFLAATKYAEKKNLDIIGFYHSHPDAPAYPSQYDKDHAWPWYSYVIVSVLDRQAGELTSWILDDGRACFNEEHVELIDEGLS